MGSDLTPEQIAENEALAAEIKQVRKTLRSKVTELLEADAAKIPGIVQEIQRLRIAQELLRENLEGTPSDGVYREMVLLTRMHKSGDVVDPAEEDGKRLEAELPSLGVTPDAAMRIARVFERMSHEGTNLGDDPTFEPPDD
jgi:hypothetical protein